MVGQGLGGSASWSRLSKTVFPALKIRSDEEVYKSIIILKYYCISVDISFRQRQVSVFLLCILVGHRVNT